MKKFSYKVHDIHNKHLKAPHKTLIRNIYFFYLWLLMAFNFFTAINTVKFLI